MSPSNPKMGDNHLQTTTMVVHWRTNNGGNDSDSNDEEPYPPNRPKTPKAGQYKISEAKAHKIFRYVQYVIVNNDNTLCLKDAYPSRAWVMAYNDQKRTTCANIKIPNAFLHHFDHISYYLYEHYHPLLSYYAPTDTWEHNNIDKMWNKIEENEKASKSPDHQESEPDPKLAPRPSPELGAEPVTNRKETAKQPSKPR